MTLLLSNQRLIVSVPGVCSITLSQQTAHSPQRHGYASYLIGLISVLKEYKAHPPLPPAFWSVADSLFTQCRPSTLLIHQLVYLHFQLIASVMRSDSESSSSFVCDPKLQSLRNASSPPLSVQLYTGFNYGNRVKSITQQSNRPDTGAVFSETEWNDGRMLNW